MPQEMWWTWIILAVVLAIGEMFHAGFFLLWFAIGAAVAGVTAYMNLSPGVQMVTFIIVSGGLFAASRKFAERWTRHQPQGIGANRLIGKKGIVIEQVDNYASTGSVRIDREEWRASSETGDILPVGSLVEVCRIEGTRAIVKTITEES